MPNPSPLASYLQGRPPAAAPAPSPAFGRPGMPGAPADPFGMRQVMAQMSGGMGSPLPRMPPAPAAPPGMGQVPPQMPQGGPPMRGTPPMGQGVLRPGGSFYG